MVDRTYYYNDEAQLTYKEKDGLITFFTDLENYNSYYRILQNYGQLDDTPHVVAGLGRGATTHGFLVFTM